MREWVGFSYNEVARVYSRSGSLIGTGQFRGRASGTDEDDMWSWKGALTVIDFDPQVAALYFDLRIEFADGASGDAVYAGGYGSGRIDWNFIEVQGRGTPPRA